MKPRGPKEEVYDKQIAPLITQVIELCKRHNINMVLDFELDDNPDVETRRSTGEDWTLHCSSERLDPSAGVKITRVSDALHTGMIDSEPC